MYDGKFPWCCTAGPSCHSIPAPQGAPLRPLWGCRGEALTAARSTGTGDGGIGADRPERREGRACPTLHLFLSSNRLQVAWRSSAVWSRPCRRQNWSESPAGRLNRRCHVAGLSSICWSPSFVHLNRSASRLTLVAGLVVVLVVVNWRHNSMTRDVSCCPMKVVLPPRTPGSPAMAACAATGSPPTRYARGCPGRLGRAPTAGRRADTARPARQHPA